MFFKYSLLFSENSITINYFCIVNFVSTVFHIFVYIAVRRKEAMMGKINRIFDLLKLMYRTIRRRM